MERGGKGGGKIFSHRITNNEHGRLDGRNVYFIVPSSFIDQDTQKTTSHSQQQCYENRFRDFYGLLTVVSEEA